jgi:hypothetical protein
MSADRHCPLPKEKQNAVLALRISAVDPGLSSALDKQSELKPRRIFEEHHDGGGISVPTLRELTFPAVVLRIVSLSQTRTAVVHPMISPQRMVNPRTVVSLIAVTLALGALSVLLGWAPFHQRHSETMIILRGIASREMPRGQLDDRSALEYARRSGYRGEVLDVAGDADGPQAGMALKRIREDQSVTAIYGFSGGGYNARAVWSQLNEDQRRRIKKIVVVGSPGVTKANFQGVSDVTIKTDPPAGHTGPKELLESSGS